MTPRKASPEVRREQIIEAAMRTFAEKGFAEATMDDIVVASGLSKGGLYWHFKSKDEIISAILDLTFAEEAERLNDLVEAEGSARERLRQLARQVTARLVALAALYPLTLEFYALAARRADVQQTLRGYFERYQASLIPLIQQGIRRGEFRDGGAEQVALAFIALFEGLALLWMLDPNAINLEARVAAATDLLLDGLRP
jgi:AcrR family transcriptional regulator